jgi:DNA-binding transcriptional LysR family regulator
MALLDHLQKLPHFVGVATAGSIRGYATARRLSQPAVSKSIQTLESDLEVALFVRGKKGVSLTVAGNDLLQFAKELLTRASETEGLLRLRADLRLEGRFTLGAYPSIAVYFLPKLVAHLSLIQEGLHLDFVTAPSATLVQSLLAGSVDFIISVAPPKRPGMVHRTLYEDTYSLFGHASESARGPRPRIFTVASAKDGTGRTLRGYLDRAGVLSHVVDCGDFESAKAMVDNGLGWGLLPERVAAPLLSTGKVSRVTSVAGLQSIGRHSVAFSCLRHRQADQSVRWLEDQIQLMLREPNGL